MEDMKQSQASSAWRTVVEVLRQAVESLRSKVEATIGPYFQVAAFTTLFSVVEKMLVRTLSRTQTWRESVRS